MNALKSLTLLGLVAVFAFSTTGCARQSGLKKDVASLQSQMAVVADELARLDQGLQDARGGSVQGESVSAAAYAGGGASPTYRTPSGFELPSLNIQKALKNAGYYRGNVDGKIGAATQEAVRAFQKDNGLEPDGIVGRQTWERLKVYLGAAIK